jgi:hypothetical protein
VRLVRLAQQQSKVAEDIRAALASLGRGGNVIGGLALIGVQPAGDSRVIDAVVVLPGAVVVVIGVDLPDPAMRLEAPLHGQWKADGWPLVHADETVNPATAALALAESVTKILQAANPAGEPVGTVIAVGPFVDSIDQPPADAAGTVRVLYPTPTSMLAAIVSLASTKNRRSVRHVRDLVRTLVPDAPELTDDMLLAEGFIPASAEAIPVAVAPKALVAEAPTISTENPLATFTPTIPAEHPGKPQPIRRSATATATVTPPIVMSVPRPVTPPAPPTPQPAAASPSAPPPPTPPPAAPTAPQPRSATVRWVPIGAIGLLVALLITAVIVAISSDDSSNAGGPASTPPPTPATTAPATSTSRPAPSVKFTLQASSSDEKCASHGFGDVQASLQQTSCSGVKRASFATLIDGRQAATTVAVIAFPSAEQAIGFRAVADTPGGGGILDVATETGKWPNPAPQFDGAAYASSIDGDSVRLVEVAWNPGPSTPGDPALVRAAKSALSLAITA